MVHPDQFFFSTRHKKETTMFQRALIVLAFLAFLPLAVSAQDLKLGITQTKNSTTLTVKYAKPLPSTKIPQIIMLGIAMKEGKTLYPFSRLPFFSNDLALLLDQPMLLPIARLDEKGQAKIVLPMGTAGTKVVKFFLQAVYVKVTLKKGKFPIQGEFNPSNVLKEVEIGLKGK
jgi:hypothetical protein